MRYFFTCFLLLLAFPFIPNLSLAQTDTAWYQLPPIVVTATRYPDSTMKIPAAISIINKFQLQQLKGAGIDEALGETPGVLAQSRSGGQDIRLTIRGFGARGAGERSNAGTSRGVRVMLDGFPETEPDGRTSFDLVDLSSAGTIEIVRSNNSAVWGNAGGGVLNILSDNNFPTPRVYYQSHFGSFGYDKEILKVGSTVGDGRYFLALSRTNFDGWRHHSDYSRTLINTSLTTAIGTHSSLGIYLAAADSRFRIPGPLTPSQFAADPQQAQGDTNNYNPTYLQRNERRHNRLGRLGATFSHEFDAGRSLNAMLYINPKYLQRSERNTFRDFTRYHFGGNLTFQQRFKRHHNIGGSVLIGLDEAYQDGAILFYSLENGNRGTELQDDKREGANNLGLFLQAQADFGDRWYVLMGIRLDEITYYYDDHIDPKLNDRKTFRALTPKAGLAYRLSPHHSLYFNLGGGVEVPAGNETNPPSTFGQDTVTALNPLLEPIRSTTFEIGAKKEIAGEDNSFLRNLTYDIAMYRIDIRDDIIPYRGGRFYFTAGKTRRLGMEMAVSAKLTGGVSFGLAATLSQNRYLEYRVDSVHYGVPGSYAEFNDNKMAGVPEFFFKTHIRYESIRRLGAYCEISAQGVGAYFADDANSLEVDSYTILNASLGFNRLSLNKNGLFMSGFLAMNNLTDRKYISSAFINPDSSPVTGEPIYIEPGLPRNFTGSISVGWEF